MATKSSTRTQSAKKSKSSQASKTKKALSTASSNGHRKNGAQSKSASSTATVDSKTWTEMKRVFDLQKKKAIQLRQSTAKERITKLKKIKDVIYKYQSEIQDALRKDFNKSEAETDITEILPTIGETKDAIRHLSYWMKPIRANTPMTLFGAVSEIHYEPRGTVLIISPWNYPFHLALAPIVAAIAAGNTVILKPSEYTPQTSDVTRRMLAEVFSEDEVAVFEGDYRVSTALTDLPFDHIFFTGSTAVGKIIMERAAKNLTTVTLELGGKSPAVVTEGANLKQAAQAVLWGKFLNAGQTCVAPDYLLIHESQVDQFVAESKKAVGKFFGDHANALQGSKDFCRIVNSRNFERVNGYIEEAVAKGAKVVLGGGSSPKENFVEPTLLAEVPMDSKVMQDEIFGPILPMIPYKNLDEAIDFINSKDKPLALYIFAKAREKVKAILKATSSGGAVVNDVIVHLANSNLPFGGVNHSGHGSYHGHFGFKEFSHERSVLKQAPLSSVKLMYPPYTNFVRKIVDATTKYLM